MLALHVIALCFVPAAQSAEPEPKPVPVREEFQRHAARLRPSMDSALARAFLDSARRLPAIQPRTLLRSADKKTVYTPAEATGLSATQRDALETLTLEERFYYTTRYGSPLAYCRALDLVAPRLDTLRGKRVLDFGYGTIGHLRMMAECGAHAVGVEVDPLLAVLYAAPGDQGPIGASGGTLEVFHGRFPAEDQVVKRVGAGYHLVVSKNVLKRGYIHPAQPVDERMMVKLGVTDAEFCKAIYDVLAPGGLFLIYNLSPKQNPPDKPYIPWADGRCPFSTTDLTAAGLVIDAMDIDDSAAAREMARLLEWDQAGMDIDNGLFAHYTLVRKPGK